MKTLLIGLTLLFSLNSFGAVRKVDSIIFNQVIPVSDATIDAIISETNYKKFYEETFELKVKCNRYKSLKEKAKTKPIHCDIIGAAKDDFSEATNSTNR